MICPLPAYWMCHAIIALAIATLVSFVLPLWLGLAIGAGFYAVRETLQWMGGKPFDWPGLLAPVIACAIAGALSWL